MWCCNTEIIFNNSGLAAERFHAVNINSNELYWHDLHSIAKALSIT